MKFLLCEDENGIYEKDGKRYNLLVCSWVKGPRANEFQEYNTLEEAEKAYGLEMVEVEDEELATSEKPA